MNNRSHPPFWKYPIDRLDRISQNGWGLFLVLAAIRCVVRPYAGIGHDARLYSLQAMNRATGGFFNGDLFFLCGSQDSYSIFSRLMAPLVAVLGPSWSFMLVYTAATALLIFAEIRLVRRLLPDRRAANVALVLLAVTELPWAGLGVFRLHEPFLTARLPAVALTLLGLERLLDGRHLEASLLMLLAFTLHPLMAVGGILVGVAHFCATKRLSKYLFWIAVSVSAAIVGAIMLWPPAAAKLFGYVDPAWYDVVRRRTPYNFLSAWSISDWCWVAYSLGVLGVAGQYLDRPAAAMLRLVLLLGLAAVAGSAVAEWSPNALLLKGQPYRGLWLAQFMAVPLGVLLMFRLWEQGTAASRLGAVLVLAATGRLFQSPPGDGASWMQVLGQAPGLFSGAALALIAIVAVALVYWAARGVRGTAWAAAILWCAGTMAAFICEDRLKGLGSFAEDRPHAEFVAEFIREHRGDRAGVPTVYWPTDPTYVWFQVPAASFYSWSQTAGVVFHRGTAMEGQRRALLVRSFEIANLRKHHRRDVFRRHFSPFYQADFDAPRPTRRELIALCREEPLDFVVLRQKFAGLVAATDGAVFIYDCRSIRDEQTGAVRPISREPAGHRREARTSRERSLSGRR